MTFHLAQSLVVDFAKNRSLMVECDIHHGVPVLGSFSLRIMKRAHDGCQITEPHFLDETR